MEVNKSNEDEVRELLQRSAAQQAAQPGLRHKKITNIKQPKETKFKMGDIVRISRAKGIFDKGYKFNWSEELFKITKSS